MSKKTTKLIILTVVFFFLSVLTYYFEHRRGTDLVAGAEFIKGLDISSITKLELKGKNKGNVELIKEGGGFVLSNFNSFPVSTTKINEFLYNISNIQVKEKIASTIDRAKNFKVVPEEAEAHIALFDKNDKKLVEFFVGEGAKGTGNYLRKESSDTTYLSSERLNLNITKDFFIEKNIIKSKKEEILSIIVKRPDGEISIKKEGTKFQLDGSSKDKVDDSKIGSFVDAFSNINFSEFYQLDDSKVSSLNFDTTYEVTLKDNFVYIVQTAEDKKNKKFYFKLTSRIEDLPNKVQLSKNASKEDLQKVNGMLMSRDKASNFNNKHARWIYEIPKFKFDNLNKNKSDFIVAKK